MKMDILLKIRSYNRIINPEHFNIIISCKRCGDTESFIGVNSDTINVICTNCGHVEAVEQEN